METKRDQKANCNNETVTFFSEPKYTGVTLNRTLTNRGNLESYRTTLTSRVPLLRRLASSDWCARATTLRTVSLTLVGHFNDRLLRSCLVAQCSHPPHRPRHQWRLANGDWMPASYTSGIFAQKNSAVSQKSNILAPQKLFPRQSFLGWLRYWPADYLLSSQASKLLTNVTKKPQWF